MQRRKKRGNDGREVTKEKRRGGASDDLARGRGESRGEQEMPDDIESSDVTIDLKNDRRERPRDRHE